MLDANTNSNSTLVSLALLLLDLVPHAADPERVFSAMGWFSDSRRNRMSQGLLTALTAIKMETEECLRQRKPKEKPTRPVEGTGIWVTTEEALAPAAATSAAAAAMPAPVAPAAEPAHEAELDGDFDLLAATAEQLDTVLAELFNTEKEGQQVLDATVTFTELLMEPWSGINVMGAQLDPRQTGAPQPTGPPLGALGSGDGTAFSAAELAQQMLAGNQPP